MNDYYEYGDPEDICVPEGAEELVEDLCDGVRRCVVMRDFTPIKPDVEEYRFYAEDIGPVLEFNTEDGRFALLVDCSYCGLLLPIPPPPWSGLQNRPSSRTSVTPSTIPLKQHGNLRAAFFLSGNDR